MKMFVFNESIDDFAIANSVLWYDHVFRQEDGHVLIKKKKFEVEGQRKKRRPKRKWKKLVDRETMKVGLTRKHVLHIQNVAFVKSLPHHATTD